MTIYFDTKEYYIYKGVYEEGDEFDNWIVTIENNDVIMICENGIEYFVDVDGEVLEYINNILIPKYREEKLKEILNE